MPTIALSYNMHSSPDAVVVMDVDPETVVAPEVVDDSLTPPASDPTTDGGTVADDVGIAACSHASCSGVKEAGGGDGFGELMAAMTRRVRERELKSRVADSFGHRR